MDKDLFHRLKARLTAADMVLTNATPEAKEAMSHIQGRAVVTLIQQIQGHSQPLTEEECADLSAMAMRVPWAGTWLVTILGALSKPIEKEHEQAEDKGKHRRRNQLVMPALLSYFTSSEWSLLLATNVPSQVRMEHVFRRMLQLNVRNPTERCIQ